MVAADLAPDETDCPGCRNAAAAAGPGARRPPLQRCRAVIATTLVFLYVGNAMYNHVGPTVFNGYGKNRDGGQKRDLEQTRGGRESSGSESSGRESFGKNSTRTPSAGFSDRTPPAAALAAYQATLATEPLGLTHTRTTAHSLPALLTCCRPRRRCCLHCIMRLLLRRGRRRGLPCPAGRPQPR